MTVDDLAVIVDLMRVHREAEGFRAEHGGGSNDALARYVRIAYWRRRGGECTDGEAASELVEWYRTDGDERALSAAQWFLGLTAENATHAAALGELAYLMPAYTREGDEDR